MTDISYFGKQLNALNQCCKMCVMLFTCKYFCICFQMSRWATSKQLPGQFTGNSSGIMPMRPKDHASGPQAWARKVTINSIIPAYI